MKHGYKRHIIYILLFPLGVLLSLLASNAPDLVEKAYSNVLFKIIGQALNLVSGVFPFSTAELLVISAAAFIIYQICRIIILLLRRRKNSKKAALWFLLNILSAASIVYFLFIITWGLNYHRQPFSKIAGLETSPSSVDELADLCQSLIDRANELRKTQVEDENGVMQIADGYKGALSRAYKGYVNASKVYPELGGRFGRPKGVMLSPLMSYSGITGIYFPLTGEANVNISTPHLLLPSTAAHEMAHQRGFAREDEANYIAYLVCSMHPDTDFQYSGTVLALIHSMNALYDSDREKCMELVKQYSDGLKRDLNDHNSYWNSLEGPIEQIANNINDAYLKSNMQSDGVKSYGRMVDLLLAEYKLKHKK